MEDEIKSSFVAPEFCVLHWHGKVMEDPHKKRSDRQAILISGTQGYEQGKLLGVPEVDSTGSSQATAIFSLAQQWDLADDIVGLSSDTAASNSGWQNGECVKIEILLEKKVVLFCMQTSQILKGELRPRVRVNILDRNLKLRVYRLPITRKQPVRSTFLNFGFFGTP